MPTRRTRLPEIGEEVLRKTGINFGKGEHLPYPCGVIFLTPHESLAQGSTQRIQVARALETPIALPYPGCLQDQVTELFEIT